MVIKLETLDSNCWLLNPLTCTTKITEMVAKWMGGWSWCAGDCAKPLCLALLSRCAVCEERTGGTPAAPSSALWRSTGLSQFLAIYLFGYLSKARVLVTIWAERGGGKVGPCTDYASLNPRQRVA